MGTPQSPWSNMRTRCFPKNIYLNEKETKILQEKCNKLGKTYSEFIRELILGYVHDDNTLINIHNVLYELRKMGNNINQIAYVANSKGVITKFNLEEELNRLNEIIDKLEQEYFN